MIPGLEDTEKVGTSSEGPGAKLRAERERRKWEVSKVSDQLNLKPSMVESIESDDLSRLPEPVFARGYIRSYATLFGMQPEPLLADFDQLNPETSGPVLVDNTIRPQMRANHLIVRLTTVLVILAMIGALVFWLRDHNGVLDFVRSSADSVPAVEQDVQQISPVQQPILEATEEQIAAASTTNALSATTGQLAIEPQDAEEANDAAIGQADTGLLATEAGQLVQEPIQEKPTDTLATETDVENQPTTLSELLTATEQAPAPEPKSSQLLAHNDTWVNIRDADGNRVKYGTLKAGTVVPLTGPRPWLVVIGNASGVALYIDGEIIDLSSYSKGNVARATLPAETP